MKKVFVLMSFVGGMRFVHGVVSNEDTAEKWVKDCSWAYASSGATYSYREYELDKPN